MAVNGKKKGNRYENDLKNRWIKNGLFPDVLVARVESTSTDNRGIDFVNTKPFIIQAKHNEKLGNRHDIVAGLAEEKGVPVLMHKMNYRGTVAIMALEDWEKVMFLLKENGLLDQLEE